MMSGPLKFPLNLETDENVVMTADARHQRRLSARSQVENSRDNRSHDLTLIGDRLWLIDY